MGNDKYLFYSVKTDDGERHHAVAYDSIVMATHVESDFHPDGLLFLKTVGGAELKFRRDARARYEAMKRSGMEEYVVGGEYSQRVSVRLAGAVSVSYVRGDEYVKSQLFLRRGDGELELEGGMADHFWGVFRGPDGADGGVEEVEGEM